MLRNLIKNSGVKALSLLIAKPNSQAHCENFHPVTIFERTRCKLAIASHFAMSGKESLLACFS